MSHRRVVITGMGAVTPLGNDLASSWDGIVNGRSGIGPITHFDPTGFSTKIAGQQDGIVEKTVRIHEDHVQILKRDVNGEALKPGGADILKALDDIPEHGRRDNALLAQH